MNNTSWWHFKLLKWSPKYFKLHLLLVYLQYAKMVRIFVQYSRQTGASGNIRYTEKDNRRIFCIQTCHSWLGRLILGVSNFRIRSQIVYNNAYYLYFLFKHVTADLVGSSSGSGILESGDKVCTIMHTIFISYSKMWQLTWSAHPRGQEF